MMTVTNYFAARDYLAGGRYKNSRPIENNTRIEKRGDDIAIRLHDTDVVTYHPDGSATLDSGGWLTVTTKDRMNRYLGWRSVRIGSDKGRWFVFDSEWRKVCRFFDGIRISQDGTVLNPPEPELEERKVEAEQKMRKRIDRYLDGYMKALAEGMPVPSSGDCWLCSFVVTDGPDKGKSWGDATDDNHLISHLTERYYVPTLLWNAMKARGYRDINASMSLFLDVKAFQQGIQRVRREWNSAEPDTRQLTEFRRVLGKYLRKRLIPTVAV